MAELPDDLKKRIELAEEASKSLSNYNKLLNETRAYKENIAHIERGQLKVSEDLKKNEAEIAKAVSSNDKEKERELKKERRNLKKLHKINEDAINQGEKELDIRKKAVKEVNLLNVAREKGLDIGRKITNSLIKQGKQFFEQQKSVKETELSMGLLSNQANGFRNNIYRASINTNQIGVDTKGLAKIQGVYADNVGRAVQLNGEELENMAALAKGTMLGAEGAAEFAGQMEKFNISAESSVDYVEDVVNKSSEMGLNANKVIKNIQSNIGLLNRYNFKEGVKGLGKMAELATKFKFQMQDIANLAEKVITPEGAVEVAARLQVLGGEWSKLGDPFELMYRSRNDLAGLQEDVINATKATARFNETTGEIMIDPMEMHRLREVANATGMSFDSLANSAREAAKFDQIKKGMSNIFKDEDKDFLASMAKFDKETGQFKVTMQTEEGETITENVQALRRITPSLIQSQRDLKKSLEERAKQAITFDETLVNLTNSFKTLLFPGFEAFAGALQNSVGDFHDWAVDSGAMDKFANFAKNLGELSGSLVKLIVENPFESAIGLLLGKAAMWYARGFQLGKGFNAATFGRGGGGGGMFDMFSGKSVKGADKGAKSVGRMGKLGKVGKGLGKASLPLALLSAGYDAFSNFNDDSLDSGDAALKTFDQNKYMAIGAGIGTLVAPGAGTVVGAGIGGLADFGSGFLKDDGLFGDYGGGNQKPKMFNDFIARPGENPINFSPKDTVVGAKKGGPIDRMIEQTTTNNTTNVSNSGASKVSVEFKDSIKIEGSIDVNSSSDSAKIDLDDPILMRNLSKMIMEELSKAISGGKIGSNPVSIS